MAPEDKKTFYSLCWLLVTSIQKIGISAKNITKEQPSRTGSRSHLPKRTHLSSCGSSFFAESSAWYARIEVLEIGTQDTTQLLLVQDEQVIETLATHAAQKAFTDGIGPWCVVGRFQYLDAAGCGYARETGSKLVITITDEILRPLSISCRLP